MAASACKYTVLLLSAPLGSGHKMAAEALEEAFKKHGNVKVVNGSAFDFFPKCWATLFWAATSAF